MHHSITQELCVLQRVVSFWDYLTKNQIHRGRGRLSIDSTLIGTREIRLEKKKKMSGRSCSLNSSCNNNDNK